MKGRGGAQNDCISIYLFKEGPSAMVYLRQKMYSVISPCFVHGISVLHPVRFRHSPSSHPSHLHAYFGIFYPGKIEKPKYPFSQTSAEDKFALWSECPRSSLNFHQRPNFVMKWINIPLSKAQKYIF